MRKFAKADNSEFIGNEILIPEDMEKIERAILFLGEMLAEYSNSPKVFDGVASLLDYTQKK